MKFRYRPYKVTLYDGGPKTTVYRPVCQVVLHGPHETLNLNALFDTGADKTMFPIRYAEVAGIVLDESRPGTIRGVGGNPIKVYPGKVDIELTDGRNSYRWSAEVCFAPGNNVLIGHLGALEFFIATFDHEARMFEIYPNNSFSAHSNHVPE